MALLPCGFDSCSHEPFMNNLTFKLMGHTVTTVRDTITGWTTHIIIDEVCRPVSRIGVIGMHEAKRMILSYLIG